jgi:hypothetical protein
MPRKPKLDASLLQAALEGLEQQKNEINKKIATVRGMLGVPKAQAGAAAAPARRKRKLSRAARKRISEAQKRRWALAKAKASKKGGA